MNALLAPLAIGATLGFGGMLHCAGMCGPLAASCGTGRRGAMGVVHYQLGRLTSYSLGGAAAGAIGHGVALGLPARIAETALSLCMAGTLAWSAWSLWRRSRPADATAREVTLRATPRRSRVGRVLAYAIDRPWLLGLVTPLLPCGLSAAVFVASGAAGSSASGLVSAASFALVTGPVLAVAGYALVRARALGRAPVAVAAAALALGAVVCVVRPLPLLRSTSATACHER